MKTLTGLAITALIIAVGYGYNHLTSAAVPAPAKDEWVLRTPEKPKPAAPLPAGVGLPVRLVVPKLGISSTIRYMGVTPDGKMDVPADISEAGWYKHGPLPGTTGSAVISGHVNGSRGQPGIFGKLADLQPGDLITTVDSGGLSTVFSVQTSKRYAQNEQAAEVFHDKSGVRLNLITCVGAWSQSDRQYAERLVVFAIKK